MDKFKIKVKEDIVRFFELQEQTKGPLCENFFIKWLQIHTLDFVLKTETYYEVLDIPEWEKIDGKAIKKTIVHCPEASIQTKILIPDLPKLSRNYLMHLKLWVLKLKEKSMMNS